MGSPPPKSTTSCARSGRARADDVLWRRTKCGIGMTDREREHVAAYVTKAVAVADAPAP